MVTSIRVTSSYFFFVISFFFVFLLFCCLFFIFFFFYFLLFSFSRFQTDGSSDRAASTTVSRGQLVDDVAIEFQTLRNLFPLSLRSRSIFYFFEKPSSVSFTRRNERKQSKERYARYAKNDHRSGSDSKIPKRDPHSRSLYTRVTFLYGSLL